MTAHAHARGSGTNIIPPEIASGDGQSLRSGPEHAALRWDAPALALVGCWTNSKCGQLDGSALASLSQHTQIAPAQCCPVEILRTVKSPIRLSSCLCCF